MKSIEELWMDHRVALAQLDSPDYLDESIRATITDLSKRLEWSSDTHGPFGKVIDKGSRVVIKPNFVSHRNQGLWGMDPLITHPSLVRAITEAVLQAEPSEIIIGDAPLQSCDFDALMQVTHLKESSDELQARDSRFKGIRDFRRTTCSFVDGVRVASEGLKPEDDFLLFDLADESLLEEVCDISTPFRVTCYDPRLLSE